jgi:hypothetical protein
MAAEQAAASMTSINSGRAGNCIEHAALWEVSFRRLFSTKTAQTTGTVEAVGVEEPHLVRSIGWHDPSICNCHKIPQSVLGVFDTPERAKDLAHHNMLCRQEQQAGHVIGSGSHLRTMADEMRAEVP